MAAGGFDLGEAIDLRFRGVASQQVGHAEDRIHRRAQLVAHGGKERALGAVRRLRGVTGLFQFRRACSHERFEVQAVALEFALDRLACRDVLVHAAQPSNAPGLIDDGSARTQEDSRRAVLVEQGVLDVAESAAHEAEILFRCGSLVGAHELVGASPHDLVGPVAEAALHGGGDEGVAPLGVHLPDPVCRHFSDGAEALLRGAQRELRGPLVAQVGEHEHDVVEASVLATGAAGVGPNGKARAVLAHQPRRAGVVLDLAKKQFPLQFEPLGLVFRPGEALPVTFPHVLPAVTAHVEHAGVRLDQHALGRDGRHADERAVEIGSPVTLTGTQC